MVRFRALLCAVVLAGAARAQDGGETHVSVRVVGPTGCPLPGVRIGRASPREALGRTDAAGTLRVRVRRGEEIRVLDEVFAPDSEIATTRGWERVPPVAARAVGDEVVLRCEQGVAGTVRFVDAETGAEMEGVRWSAVDYASRTVGPGIVLCGPGDGGKILVTPPAGYLLWEHDVKEDSFADRQRPYWDGELRFGSMSHFARSVHALVPLRKAVEVEIAVKDPKGNPPRGVTVTSVEAGGMVRALNEEITAGRVRLFVPHFREGRVSVRFRRATFWGSDLFATWTTKLGWDFKAKISGSIRFPDPKDSGPEEKSAMGIGVMPREPPPPERVGQLAIRARRFDGSPAEGLPVKLIFKKDSDRTAEATLDEEGEATFDELATGRWVVDLRAAGFLGRTLTVEIAEDLLEIDYDEPAGGRLEVAVVDQKGRPLPFADLWLSNPKDERWTGMSWEVDGAGSQRVDMFTDRKGRRTLLRLPEGELEVHARYGGRKGSAIAAVPSGGVGELQIVVDDEP